MNKNEFLHRLTAISNQIRFSSDSEFDDMFRDGDIKFVRYGWTKPEKTIITISVKTVIFKDKDEMNAEIERDKNISTT